MSFRLIALIASASALSACGGGAAETNQAASNRSTSAVPTDGAPKTATKTIADFASGSADHSTLVRAVQTAGLAPTLAGAGPYTLFAPTNAAFAKLPAGAVDGLLRPEAKGQLTGLLTQHVVTGLVTAADLKRAIQNGNGKAELATVGGGKLTATEAGGALIVTDAKGGQARVTQGDVMQSNGVVHVVDTVLQPA